LELRAGIIEGSWTPLAAKQATWVVAGGVLDVEIDRD
jgi:hypothetical protein